MVELEAQDGIEQGRHPFARCGRRAERGRPLLHGLPQGLDPCVEDRADQARAIAETAEERPLADPGRRRDVVHRHTAGARTAGEELIGGRQDGLAVAERIRARLAFGHGRTPFTKRTVGPYGCGNG